MIPPLIGLVLDSTSLQSYFLFATRFHGHYAKLETSYRLFPFDSINYERYFDRVRASSLYSTINSCFARTIVQCSQFSRFFPLTILRCLSRRYTTREESVRSIKNSKSRGSRETNRDDKYANAIEMSRSRVKEERDSFVARSTVINRDFSNNRNANVRRQISSILLFSTYSNGRNVCSVFLVLRYSYILTLLFLFLRANCTNAFAIRGIHIPREELSKSERERAKEHTELILPFSLTQLRNNDDDNNDDQRRIRSFFVAFERQWGRFSFSSFFVHNETGQSRWQFRPLRKCNPFHGE